MSDLLSDSNSVWALILVVVIPVFIIGAGELEERLRQRDSAFTRTVSILRTWTVPLFAGWALATGLFDLSSTNLIVQVLATGLLLTLAFVALGIVRILVQRIRRLGEGSERGGIPELLLALPRLAVILATGWILIDTVWGVDLSAAFAALGVTSLVISFALQDTLSGLASGLLLLSDAPFEPGDWIRSGDVEGQVLDINWRSSRIQDRNGDLHVVPNGQLANATVINFDQPSRVHRVVVPVQVAFVNPPTLAKDMLLAAARTTDGVLADPPPAVRIVQIDDPLMGYEVHMWIDDYAIAPRVATEFGRNVWYQSHRHDVPLPSPAQDLYLYDGVEAGLAGKPDSDEIRRRLTQSPLLSQLGDDDLDRIAKASRPARFAEGETVLEASRESREPYVLWQGRARMVATGPHDEIVDVGEIVEGDVFGLVGRSAQWPAPPRIVAVTDCEVLIIDQEVAQEIISKDPALAGVLNQMLASRRRRLSRIFEGLTGQVIGEQRDAAVPIEGEQS
jgi:small-conductance mechanosensitive channel